LSHGDIEHDIIIRKLLDSVFNRHPVLICWLEVYKHTELTFSVLPLNSAIQAATCI